MPPCSDLTGGRRPASSRCTPMSARPKSHRSLSHRPSVRLQPAIRAGRRPLLLGPKPQPSPSGRALWTRSVVRRLQDARWPRDAAVGRSSGHHVRLLSLLWLSSIMQTTLTRPAIHERVPPSCPLASCPGPFLVSVFFFCRPCAVFAFRLSRPSRLGIARCAKPAPFRSSLSARDRLTPLVQLRKASPTYLSSLQSNP